MVNLSMIENGKKVRIKRIESSFLRPKLMEMGILEGDCVQVLFKAPFGDPIAYELEEYTLSMRNKESDTITVKLLDPLFNI